MKNKVLFIVTLFVGLFLLSCEMPNNNESNYSKPTIESVTLNTTNETYVYYCFKSVVDAENYFGIRYDYSTETINTLLDSAVKNLMTSKGYEITITYKDLVYVINRKRGNTYYYNSYMEY
jgi:hypothetical protein